MNKRFLLCLFSISILAMVILPVQAVCGDDLPLFERQHQAGIRIGTWVNGGDEPPLQVIDEFGNELRTDFSKASIYFEGFGAYRISPQFMIELSIGFVNRGDVNFTEGPREYFGNLLLYPMLLQFKWYMPTVNGKLMPYVFAGGGIYYGRNSVQFTNDIYFAFNEDSETDFSYVLGGGFDWPVASSIGLELNAKYMPVKFGKELVLIKDYQAFTITFGVKYLFTSPGDDSGRRR